MTKSKFRAAMRRLWKAGACLWWGHTWERTHVLNSKFGRLDLYRCDTCGKGHRTILKRDLL